MSGYKSIYPDTTPPGYITGALDYEKAHAMVQKELLSLDSDGILKNDIKSFNENGYLILHNLLSNTELAEIQKESSRLISVIPNKQYSLTDTNLTKRYYSTVSATRKYDSMILNSRVNNILKYYLFRNYLLMVSMLIDILPNEKVQRLHRDNGSAVFGPPSSHPGYDRKPLVISTMWAITDFTEDNGATVLIPKSHLWDLKRRVNFKKDKLIQAVMPAGSVIMWFDGLVHGGGANISNGDRIGALLIYGQPWIRPQENAMLSMPFEDVENLPKEIQTLIGYGLHGAVGVVADEFGQGRHPKHAPRRILNKYSKL